MGFARFSCASWLLAIVVTMLLAGCRSRAPQATAPSSEPAAEARNSNPDEPTTDLPPDYTKAIPLFPGAAVAHVRKPRGAMREILFSADAQLDPLIKFYKDTLTKDGFEITATLKMAARRTWSCDFHKSGQQASVMLFPLEGDPSRMTIDLIYEMPSKNPLPVEPPEVFDVVGPGEPGPITPNGQKRN